MPFSVHAPGLKAAFPAAPYEAKELMEAALGGADPGGTTQHADIV